MSRWFCAIALLLMIGGSVRAWDHGKATELAQAARPAGQPSKTQRDTIRQPLVSVEQERVVERFVREHQRELAALLTHLKTHRNNEYQRATRDLLRTIERIEPYRQRDPERYELELKLWQTQTRAQLLAARITMTDEDQLRQQLRDTLNEQQDLRLTLLRRERDRVAERLQKLTEQVDRLEHDRDQAIDRQLAALLAETREGASTTAEKKSKPQAPPKKNSDQEND